MGPTLPIRDPRVSAGCGTHLKSKEISSPDLQISSRWQIYNPTDRREEQRGGPESSAATIWLRFMFDDRCSQATEVGTSGQLQLRREDYEYVGYLRHDYFLKDCIRMVVDTLQGKNRHLCSSVSRNRHFFFLFPIVAFPLTPE